jgi:hypothetical protein
MKPMATFNIASLASSLQPLRDHFNNNKNNFGFLPCYRQRDRSVCKAPVRYKK